MPNQLFSSNAVLVYGPRKSGTSLLHNLLDGGPEILMLPGEIKIKESLRENATKTDLPRRYAQLGRLDFPDMHVLQDNTLHARPDFSFEGLNREQSSELFDFDSYARSLSTLLQSDEFTTYHDIVRHDVESFRRALRKAPEYSGWAAKDVGGNPSRITAQFSQSFPNSKIVYLARDPRFVVRSILMDRQRKGISLKNSQVWYECVKAQKIVDFIFQQAENGAFVISYETLTKNTEATMRRVVDYLQLDFAPIYCEPTALGVPVVVRTSSQKTTKVFQPVEDWKKNLTSSQVLCMNLFFSGRPKLKSLRGQNRVSYQESSAKLPEN